jgi:hypothetical protein
MKNDNEFLDIFTSAVLLAIIFAIIYEFIFGGKI